ncbi:MAG: DUF488 family protein [Candidatus Hydrothermarchaeota archaeon]
MIKTKSVYEEKEEGDGLRVLVMRRWPRGIKRDHIDLWTRDLGPSLELLADWNGKKIAWEEYERRYMEEMRAKGDLLAELVAMARDRDITILCWERSDEHCHRRLLKGLLEARS